MDGHYIEFQNVSKAYGDHRVLDAINFYAEPGETVVILGRSGVGKSVTLGHIMGFQKPDSGRVWVAGEDITDYTEAQLQELHRKVTMVFQSGALFDSLSVFENVAFPLRERHSWTEENIEEIVFGLLDMLDLRELADAYPSELGTGMKRSAAIARALASRPEAILYDEPTTMVDPLMSQHIAELIERLKRQLKLTSIVVTHDTRLAKRVADRLVFLDAGHVTFFGTVAELPSCTNPLVQEFFREDEITLLAEQR